MSDGSSARLVEHFFRHESANLIAVLTRAFGVRRLELIEDMVQTAMLQAMHSWKQGGVPDNPAAWIHRVARNRVLDALRRDDIHERALGFARQTAAASETLLDQWLEERELPDSLLRMIFVSCHPGLERSSQIAFSLKVLAGFGIAEISRALLLPKETVKKRVQRARQRLGELRPRLELPAADALQARLETVHDVLYLIFNEGYSTSCGRDPIRDDLCESAARLCHLLCDHEVASGATRALLALMLFHSARLTSRVDGAGAVVLLEDQNRALWDRRLMIAADRWLHRATASQDSESSPSHFLLEAAVARHHCLAPSVAETDWGDIVRLYDGLMAMRPSPVYALNRAVARSQCGELDTALAELERLRDLPDLNEYSLVDCARGRVLELSGRFEEALASYRSARSLCRAEHEKTLLERKIAGCVERLES